MEPNRKPATYADLLALPDGVKAEIIDGVSITTPAPLPRHINVQGALRRFIGGPFHDDHDRGGPGGWWIFPEPDVEVDLHTVVRPDVAGWRRECLADPDVRPIRVVPDWVCEVLSPSNPNHDRITKAELYRRSGVAFFWIVDPDPAARTLEVLQLCDEQWVRIAAYDDTAIARIPPFEVVELEIGRLFLPRPAQHEGG